MKEARCVRDARARAAILHQNRQGGPVPQLAVFPLVPQLKWAQHFSIIAEHVTRNASHTQATLDQLAARFASYGGDATMQAAAQLAQMVRRKALTMAYSDAFKLIGAGLAVAIVGVFFLPKLPTACERIVIDRICRLLAAERAAGVGQAPAKIWRMRLALARRAADSERWRQQWR
jgi:hypothetical protein